MTTPRPPKGLGAAGKRLWLATQAEYELAPHETVQLLEMCRIKDRLDSLGEVILRDGTMTTTRHGEPAPHPALIESRMQQTTYARLAQGLPFPADDSRSLESSASRKASKAAKARWGIRDAALERRTS